MNQNNYVFKFFCLWLLLLSLPLLPMFSNITKRRKQQTTYEFTLKEIQNITTVSAVDDAIYEIKNKIYEELVTELEHIIDVPSISIKNFINKARTCMRKALQENSPLTQAIHEESIPSSLYNNMLTILREEKINPNNVNLHYIINQNKDEEEILTAESLDPNQFLFDFTNFIKPTINFYESLLSDTTAQQKFVCLHELKHILLRHPALRSDQETKNLRSIMEREADIHAASKNIEFAYAGQKRRCDLSNYHPNIIGRQSHCETMKIMWALMQKKEELS